MTVPFDYPHVSGATEKYSDLKPELIICRILIRGRRAVKFRLVQGYAIISIGGPGFI